MSNELTNPAMDFIPATVDVDLNPAGKCFLITQDKPLKIHTGSGKTRTYPAGTFNTKTIYPIVIQKLIGAAGYITTNELYYGRD
jgi:hypothetical protein